MKDTTPKQRKRNRNSQPEQESNSTEYLNHISSSIKWYLYQDNLASWFKEVATSLVKLVVFVYVVGLMVGNYCQPITMTIRELHKEYLQAKKRREEAELDKEIERQVLRTNN